MNDLCYILLFTGFLVYTLNFSGIILKFLYPYFEKKRKLNLHHLHVQFITTVSFEINMATKWFCNVCEINNQTKQFYCKIEIKGLSYYVALLSTEVQDLW